MVLRSHIVPYCKTYLFFIPSMSMVLNTILTDIWTLGNLIQIFWIVLQLQFRVLKPNQTRLKKTLIIKKLYLDQNHELDFSVDSLVWLTLAIISSLLKK